jgi:hypothetical protein
MRSLSRSVSLVVGVSLAWATSASAVRVPGSPAKAGCYAVFDVEGGSASGKKVTCSDCDASCDIGGPAGQADGQCVFMVRYCLNDTTAAPACKAAGIQKVRSHLLRPGSLTFPAPSTDTACSEATPITVKLKKKGKKPGKRVVTLLAQAVKGTKPKTERGQLVLVCTPHPTGPCPTTTTTTSTTTTSTTTTTVFSCAPSTPVACMAGSTAFTKVMFAQGQGTTFCGGAGVAKHCLTGEPGTDGKGGCSTSADCTPACIGGQCADGTPCNTNADCASLPNGTCGGGPAPMAPFSGCFGVGPNVGSPDTGCTGSDAISGLGKSCLYIGAGNATTTPPSLNPDGSKLELDAVCCANDPATTHLVATGTDPTTCTKGAGPGRHCANPANGTSPAACSSDQDCGGASAPLACALDANCFFGPPLPIASGPLSVCVINVIQQDAFGQLTTSDGNVTVTYPLSSRVYLTGNSTEPCPKCVNNVCDSGRNQGMACTPVGSEQTTLDCPPTLSTWVGPIPVSLSNVTTGQSIATADTNGVFCASDMQVQPGAFGNVFARYIVENGSPAGPLTDTAPHASTLASTFCIPASGSPAVDGAGGLPGPGATSLPGTIQLVP